MLDGRYLRENLEAVRTALARVRATGTSTASWRSTTSAGG